MEKLFKSIKKKSKKTILVEAPVCISESGLHKVELIEPPFYCQCVYCFERFVLISETVCKGMDMQIVERKIN